MEPMSDPARNNPNAENPETTPQEQAPQQGASPESPPESPTESPPENAPEPVTPPEGAQPPAQPPAAQPPVPPPAPPAQENEAPKPSEPTKAKPRPEPKPLSPSELAATVSVESDSQIDQELEAAMMGVSEADLSAEAGGPPPSDDPTVDTVVVGRIANIGSEDVLIDFGGKSLGSMSLAEFESDEKYAVGDEIKVLIVTEDQRAGLLRVSRSKARRAAVLDNMKVGLVVDAHISGMNKGGLEVEVEGMRGFIPASQVDIQFMKDISDLIGQDIRAEVTKFEMDDPGHENIVLSRRKVLLREEAALKEKMLTELEVGQVRRGKVRNLADYGAFVDIGGFDGLLHISDMSWGRIKHPDEVVKIGDEIDVKVIKINKEKKKISLSLKQTIPNPWDRAGEKYEVGTKVNGRVVRMESFGAFVELEPGLDGLLPVSEMSWTHRVRHPSDLVKEGDIVEVSVISIDMEKQRLSLSLKALADDPWANLADKYVEGSKVKGKVVRTTDFGAFVELEEGIDGLIHISELAEERIRKVTDKVQPGQEVEVRVLGVDTGAKKVSLSMKTPPREPTPEELAKIDAERAAADKRRNKKRRGGITFDFDGGGLGGLDPSKFAP